MWKVVRIPAGDITNLHYNFPSQGHLRKTYEISKIASIANPRIVNHMDFEWGLSVGALKLL